MGRRAKPAKVKVEAKRLLARKSPDNEGARDLEKRLAEALRREAEALEQHSATAEILAVISRSPSDVQPVFDAIVQSAVRLCEGFFGTVLRLDRDRLYLAAHHNLNPEGLQAYREHYPVVVNLRETVASGAILDRRVVQVIDSTDPTVPPRSLAMAKATGFRGVVVVPMLRDGEPIGVINVARRDRGPFTDRQVALLKTFADQAVIAIENVRLFKELEARNRDLSATSEILQVISRSPTDVKPVFDSIVRSTIRLCNAKFCVAYRYDGEQLHVVAHGNLTRETLALLDERYPQPPSPDTATGISTLERRVVHIPDASADDLPPASREFARQQGWGSLLAVPLLRDGQPVGSIAVARVERQPFTEQQIALVQTFADQAVIAIENVRLFNELQETNRALTGSLEQQTATSEVLRAIAHTQTDAQPVFDTIVRSAARLCDAPVAAVFLTDGRMLYHRANYGSSPEALKAQLARFPRPVAMDTTSGVAILTRTIVHVPDIEEPSTHVFVQQSGRLLGFRSVVAVPMLREGEPMGTLNVTRREAGRFSDTEVDLLKTFADQAVIAIENVRLFNDLEVANRGLQAASRHKSEFLANMSHELRTPLNAVIGFSEILSERMFGELNEKQEEYLKDIQASGQHLLSLINDILDLSKVEAGRMELELTDFHLPAALDNALTLVRERAGRHGIALHMSVDERLDQVRADERKIRQVILNLLSNAIKFTPEGGTINVLAMPGDSVVDVSVTDTGVGIAPEDQEAIFEEFRQVGTAAKKVEGTGLGLALSRKFVELHGGRIWVRSQVGVGSTFTFRIPIRTGA